jgi:CRISPR/Cas system-associated exonuclease Cas4 (RecB family)
MINRIRLADYFLFTQHSLSTFDSCPLKFKKRYAENLKWDSYPDEAVRKRLEMGNDFHLLAHRYFMGIEPGRELTDKEEELDSWVESLQRNFQRETGVRYLPEYKLRMVSENLRLEANFDLILYREGTLQIWDWKTHSDPGRKSRNAEGKLTESLQTKVYLFVLKELCSLAAGEEIPCERISMHYWQPRPPRTLAEIRYSPQMHEEYRGLLEAKIHTILNYDYTDFNRELYRSHCKFCEFNWFCNKEKVDFQAMEEDEDFLDELMWEDVEEKY